MIQKLQKTIEKLKDEKERVLSIGDQWLKARSINMYCEYKGKAQALSLCIEELTQILNEETVAATPEDGTYKEIKGLGNVRVAE